MIQDDLGRLENGTIGNTVNLTRDGCNVHYLGRKIK